MLGRSRRKAHNPEFDQSIGIADLVARRPDPPDEIGGYPDSAQFNQVIEAWPDSGRDQVAGIFAGHADGARFGQGVGV